MNESKQLYGPLWWQRIKIVTIGIIGLCVLPPIVLVIGLITIVAWMAYRIRYG